MRLSPYLAESEQETHTLYFPAAERLISGKPTWILVWRRHKEAPGTDHTGGKDFVGSRWNNVHLTLAPAGL